MNLTRFAKYNGSQSNWLYVMDIELPRCSIDYGAKKGALQELTDTFGKGSPGCLAGNGLVVPTDRPNWAWEYWIGDKVRCLQVYLSTEEQATIALLKFPLIT